MSALVIKAIDVPRMTRVTWYKHRALVLGIPGLFLLAAALLVTDSVLQRHWVSSHHLTYCLAYAGDTTSSRCLTENAPSSFGTFGFFVNYWRTEVLVVALFALAAVAGLFAGVPWVAQVNFFNPEYPGNSYVTQTWFARPGGPKQSLTDARWLAQHHLSEWVACQPLSHLVWLALARNGILIAVAALAVLASVWWLRKHPAE